MEKVTHLTLEVYRGRTDKIAVIVGLLHRRRCLVPHHGSSRYSLNPYDKALYSESLMLHMGFVDELAPYSPYKISAIGR